MRIYRNGVLEASKTGAGTFTRRAADLMLAIGPGGTNFKGDLSDLRIWDTALPESTIASRFNRQLNETEISSSNLIGYWRLEENSGATAFNAKSTASNGTLGSGNAVNPIDWPSRNTFAPVTSSGQTIQARDPVRASDLAELLRWIRLAK